MGPVRFIWDDEQDPAGNYWHICVEGHGITREEVEEVIANPRNEVDESQSSGYPATFGWTSAGEHIIAVWEKVEEDPLAVYPLTAYPVPPRKRRKKP
jgi:hypothetical protein